MTEENTAEVVVQEVTQAAPEAAVSSPERDFEKEARDIGWVPETDFKGDKAKWKPAQQFVEDGEKILPIVRSQLKRTQEELSKREADFTKRLERMERMSNTAVERLKAQHKAELDRIQTAKETAVEAGDLGEYRKLDKQERELSAAAKFEEPTPVAQADPEAVFKKANPWYGEDEDLTAYADGISQAYLKKNPDSTLEDNLRHTAEKVKAAFPQKFTKPAANGHAAVDGGGDFPSPSASKSSLEAKLPGEALKQAKADVAAKLYPTVEAWAKVYFG